MSCDGGYALVEWIDGIGFGNGTAVVIFGTGGYFSFADLPGTTVRFHTAMFRDPAGQSGTVTLRFYLDPPSFGGAPSNLVATISFSGNGFLYDVSPTIVKPIVQKALFITAQGTNPLPIDVVGLVFVMEVA